MPQTAKSKTTKAAKDKALHEADDAVKTPKAKASASAAKASATKSASSSKAKAKASASADAASTEAASTKASSTKTAGKKSSSVKSAEKEPKAPAKKEASSAKKETASDKKETAAAKKATASVKKASAASKAATAGKKASAGAGSKAKKESNMDSLNKTGVKTGDGMYSLLTVDERYEMMRLLREQNPNPKSELDFRNPFELLCAVVLSAQATDISVNKATPALFERAPDAKTMAALSPDEIGSYIQSIGLWRNKAKFLAELSKILVEKYDGKVPDNFEELVALPGVGTKTAKVVLNVAFGHPTIAVDTHIYRVSNRTGLCLGKCPGEVESRIPDYIDDEFKREAHHYILLHGRYNCTAKGFKSHCEKCVIAHLCRHNYDD